MMLAKSPLGKILLLTMLLLPYLNYAAATPAPAMAKTAMVSTTQHLATDVGIKVLKQGGNAIDAAVAIGYALAVVEPCCGNIGGGGFMLIRFNHGKTTFINFRETAPAASSTALFLDKHGKPLPQAMIYGYRPVATPGTVAGLNYALQKYGTMPLATVMQPAITLANQGYQLEAGDIALLNHSINVFNKQPNVAAIFTQHGKPYQAGDRLIQKNLGHTLSLIAKVGNAGFYQGTVAQTLVQASQQHGGVLTLQDLANYRVQEMKPLTCHYRSYQIISAPPPSSGGVTLCEILAITEHFPLNNLGYRTPAASHAIIEAMRYAYQDRDRYLGDPRFVNNPIDKLLSPAHVDAIVTAINTQKFQPHKASIDSPKHMMVASTEGHNTTHYSIIDKDGNAVSVTYTINNYFGSGVIAGHTGFFLNNEMDDFALLPNTPNEFQLTQSKNNDIQPGKQPLSSMTPTIVLKNNQLFLVLGTPGGSTIITQILETLENIIDYGMNIRAAIDAPRYHMQASPNTVFIEPGAFSSNTQVALATMGYHFHVGPPFDNGSANKTWGAVAIVEHDPRTGMRYGAIDKRVPEGLATGY